jgi:hypothetical protein
VPSPLSSTRARVTAGLLALAVAAVGVTSVAQSRADAAAEQRAERLAAQHELDRDAYELRERTAGPAHLAERASADLLVAVVEAVTGSDRDPAAVGATLEGLIGDLRAAADDLEAAAAADLPTRPAALPVEQADPVLAQIGEVDASTAGVADQLRAAADEAERFAVAANELTAAASAYAASTEALPDSDDPDVLADAWRDEQDRLAAYRATVEAVEGTAGLEDLVATHAEILVTLESLAADAVAALDADDIDGYNDRLDATLGDEDVDAFAQQLVASTEQALQAATIDELEASRTAVLELLLELEQLRRVTGPAQG